MQSWVSLSISCLHEARVACLRKTSQNVRSCGTLRHPSTPLGIRCTVTVATSRRRTRLADEHLALDCLLLDGGRPAGRASRRTPAAWACSRATPCVPRRTCGLPLVAVTLVHRAATSASGSTPTARQNEKPVALVARRATSRTARARPPSRIEGRAVQLRAWRFESAASADTSCPCLLLDAEVPENAEWDATDRPPLRRRPHYRLCQEAVLGIGGVRMLRALGYHEIDAFT